MMRILVMSDTHGDLKNAQKAIEKSGKLDMVIHLGDIIGQDEQLKEMCDCPVKIVKGNGDFYTENKPVEVIALDKNKIFATHGHQYAVDWGLDRLCYAAQEQGCNIAMYGHTHIPDVSYNGGVTLINPGSISRPRQINRKPTYVLMEIDEQGEAQFSVNYV